jgi:hypothetical protein
VLRLCHSGGEGAHGDTRECALRTDAPPNQLTIFRIIQKSFHIGKSTMQFGKRSYQSEKERSMNVIRKDATITNTDDEFPGAFRVVLSAPTKDRDGDTLLSDEWKTPLPDHITFDSDHGMSVATTVGSGTPYINDAGQVPEAPEGALIVDGTYSSLPRAQEVRTLVNEEHIRTTSVAFMTEKYAKSGVGKPDAVRRELLNGAFVAIPSNREALVLSSKALKSGARNSASDAEHIQAIHDHASALGATHGSADDAKTILAALVGRKDADTDAGSDPFALISATDAAIDEAIDLFASVDTTDLDPAIMQAIALVQAADTAIDELMEVVGIPDPDEDAEPATGDETPAAAKAAAAVESKAAADADSDAVTADLEARAMKLRAAVFI